MTQDHKDTKQMRISTRVHSLLLAEARRTHRTITGQLEAIIEWYFNRDKQKEGKDE